MSEQLPPPDPRAFAPAGKAVSTRLGGRKRVIYVGASLVAICAVSWIVSPGSKQHEEAYHSTPRASRSEYDPPKATQVAAAIPVQSAVVATQQTQQQPPPMRMVSGKAEEPGLASFSAGLAPIPDYMKPKAPEARDQSVGGIAYKATTFDGAKSFTIADQSLVLPPQPITCIMDTMVVTGASGVAPFQCHLEHDVLSPTGVVLMEAGTQVLGYYKSIVGQGENRVVAITAHARTPNGVVVPLGGPVADELGAAGVEGSVDNHWGARLGGALLLSLVDSGVSLGQSALSKDGSTSINLNSGSGGGVGSLSQQVLAQTINIPPTITLPQGTRVQLWVTKFIDFSGSYRLESRR
jgi:type IV secretory pathway VirB10-like protein